MFAANMDSAREVGGVPTTVLIPMRFVWPYGGRSVFLSGSFTRYSSFYNRNELNSISYNAVIHFSLVII